MKTIKFLLSVAVVTAVFNCAAATVPYTNLTAPDAAAVRVLQKPLTAIWGDAPAGTDRTYAIHTHFAQVIEQNFARLDAGAAKTLVDGLSEKELSDLAQLYVSSNADTGHHGELLAVLSTRLDASRLNRLSHHFGYAPVHEALINNAPAGVTAFSLAADATSAAPTPHAATVGAPRLRTMLSTGPAGGGTMSPMQFGQFANLTPFETYLALRTAPVGALGVQGALLETTFIWGAATYSSWTIGTKIGDQLAPVIQTYSPNTWDTIGGRLSGMYDQYREAQTALLAGQYQSAFGALFGITSMQSYDMSTTGGDYMCTAAWAAWVQQQLHRGDGCSICKSSGPSPD